MDAYSQNIVFADNVYIFGSNNLTFSAVSSGNIIGSIDSSSSTVNGGNLTLCSSDGDVTLQSADASVVTANFSTSKILMAAGKNVQFQSVVVVNDGMLRKFAQHFVLLAIFVPYMRYSCCFCH